MPTDELIFIFLHLNPHAERTGPPAPPQSMRRLAGSALGQLSCIPVLSWMPTWISQRAQGKQAEHGLLAFISRRPTPDAIVLKTCARKRKEQRRAPVGKEDEEGTKSKRRTG